MKRTAFLTLVIPALLLGEGESKPALRGGFGGVGFGGVIWDPSDARAILSGEEDPDGLPNYGIELPSYGFGYFRLTNIMMGAHVVTAGVYKDTTEDFQASQLYQRGAFFDFGFISSSEQGQMFLAIGVGGLGFGSLAIPREYPGDTIPKPKITSGGNAAAISVTLGFDLYKQLESRDLSYAFVGIGLRPSVIWTPTLAETPGFHKWQFACHLVATFGGVGVEYNPSNYRAHTPSK
jgi:hypothetical protein